MSIFTGAGVAIITPFHADGSVNYEKLDEYFPGLSRKYGNVFRGNYFCGSPQAKKLRSLFQSECRKYGLIFRMQDIIAAYKKLPPEPRQLSLF